MEGCPSQVEASVTSTAHRDCTARGSTEAEIQQVILPTLHKSQQRRLGSKGLPPVATGTQTQTGELVLCPRLRVVPLCSTSTRMEPAVPHITHKKPSNTSPTLEHSHNILCYLKDDPVQRSGCSAFHAISDSHEPCILHSCFQEKQPDDAA